MSDEYSNDNTNYEHTSPANEETSHFVEFMKGYMVGGTTLLYGPSLPAAFGAAMKVQEEEHAAEAKKREDERAEDEARARQGEYSGLTSYSSSALEISWNKTFVKVCKIAAMAACAYAVVQWGYGEYKEKHKVKPKPFVEEVDLTNSNQFVTIKKGCGNKIYSRVGNKLVRNPQPDGMVMAILWENKDGTLECDKGGEKYTLIAKRQFIKKASRVGLFPGQIDRTDSNDVEAASAQAKRPGFIDPALEKTSRGSSPQP